MKIRAKLFCLVAVAMTSACATAVRGTTEKVIFVSNPSGAEMKTTTGHTCITPCTLEIERSETFTASFELGGHQTAEVFVDTEIADAVAATTAANILLTPIIAIPVALAVDATSGANLNHTPNPVNVKLTAVDGGLPAEGAPEPGDGSTLAGTGPAEVEAAVEEAVAGDAEPAGTAVSGPTDRVVRPAAPDEAIPFDPGAHS